ncbi:MAG: glutamate synthase, partial [Candidatus Gallimonas sp.]
MKIKTGELDFKALNEIIRSSSDREVELEGVVGQRYIGAGLSGRTIRIKGTPGNALGAYLDGCDVTVEGNAQDAIGDTMNAGRIVINGNAGDAVGYAMRGGKIFIRGDAGYRVGIHMKAYKEHRPVIVVGGIVGSFLGEYQ